MSVMEELKPCPFCGMVTSVSCMSAAQAELMDTENLNYDTASNQFAVVCSVHCEGCGASSGYHGTMEGAVKAWNRRARNG